MPRRFHVATFGCQMNEHDSERLAGLLTDEGYEAAAAVEDVVNRCLGR